MEPKSRQPAYIPVFDVSDFTPKVHNKDIRSVL